MGSRRDYYRDPNAPRPNSLKPGASASVTDEHGRVLMQRRDDSGNWSLPGGIMEVGETLEDCAVRETREETGLDIEITGLLGIYTDSEPRDRTRGRRGPARVRSSFREDTPQSRAAHNDCAPHGPVRDRRSRPVVACAPPAPQATARRAPRRPPS
ncbi:NUDIX domain-containing protein [Nocardia sp. NPDC047038]|uniref:NUDIX domain-containing protein n=1 Tax=Nocardia sp. NPDC047038 TaxID=3154338 RepID=UPI0033FA5C52